jgi:hypothetical protein
LNSCLLYQSGNFSSTFGGLCSYLKGMIWLKKN